jgi:hypothetical protein
VLFNDITGIIGEGGRNTHNLQHANKRQKLYKVLVRKPEEETTLKRPRITIKLI